MSNNNMVQIKIENIYYVGLEGMFQVAYAYRLGEEDAYDAYWQRNILNVHMDSTPAEVFDMVTEEVKEHLAAQRDCQEQERKRGEKLFDLRKGLVEKSIKVAL